MCQNTEPLPIAASAHLASLVQSMMPSQPSSASIHGCSNMLVSLSASCHFLTLKSGYHSHVMSPLLLPLFQTHHAVRRGGGSRGHWVQAQNNRILGAAQLPTTPRGSPSHHLTPLPKRNSRDKHIYRIAEKTLRHLCLYRHLCQVGFC
jgi:hypothetical protein